MAYSFSYSYISDEANECISVFFSDNDLALLFQNLFEHMKKQDSDCIIRGRTEEIIGVSHPGERFIFYVVPSSEGYFIKFRSHIKTIFDCNDAEKLVQFALSEVRQKQKQADNKEDDTNIEDNKSNEKSPEQTANDSVPTSMPIYDEEPFYKKLGVDPEDYSDLAVSHELFSNRAFNCLMRGNILTFDVLLKNSEYSLAKIKWLGRKTLKEIIDRIIYVIKNGGYSPPVDETDTAESSDISGNTELEEDETPQLPPSLVDICKDLRRRIYYSIAEKGSYSFSEEVLIDDCVSFFEFVREWAKQILLNTFPKINDRNKEILIRRIVYNELLSEIGKDYGITRERVRQICVKYSRRIAPRLSRYPDKTTIDSLRDFEAFIGSSQPDSLFVYLNYLYTKNRWLCDTVLSIFGSLNERKKLLDLIQSAPQPIEQKKEATTIPKETASSPETPETPQDLPCNICPRCGERLVIRTARRGSNAGNRFIGCSAFPRCRFARQLEYGDKEYMFT